MVRCSSRSHIQSDCPFLAPDWVWDPRSFWGAANPLHHGSLLPSALPSKRLSGVFPAKFPARANRITENWEPQPNGGNLLDPAEDCVCAQGLIPDEKERKREKKKPRVPISGTCISIPLIFVPFPNPVVPREATSVCCKMDFFFFPSQQATSKQGSERLVRQRQNPGGR